VVEIQQTNLRAYVLKGKALQALEKPTKAIKVSLSLSLRPPSLSLFPPSEKKRFGKKA
jgi:hypothetical protein